MMTTHPLREVNGRRHSSLRRVADVLEVRPTASTVRPLRAGTAPIAVTVPTRSRLLARVDQALADSRLVLVGSAAGTGKTALVSDWASRTGPGSEVSWQSLRGASDAAEELDTMTAEVLTALPTGIRRRCVRDGLNERRRSADSSEPHRWVLVLDDFPVGPANVVNDVLDRLLRRTTPQTKILVVCSGSPALDRQRLALPGSWRSIGVDDLLLDADEIAETMSRRQVELSPSLVEQIHLLTAGWAWGVGQAVTSLSLGSPVSVALRQTDLAIADYLQNSILSGLSTRERDLVTATSVIRDVTPELAAAIVGKRWHLPPSAVTATRGFIQTHGDGSFTLHPVLRRHLLQKLGEQPDAARTTARRAAQCTAERGDSSAAIHIAVDGADWPWGAQELIESLAVPRWLALGAEYPLDRADIVDGLGDAEPILKATAALERCWPDVAELAVEDFTPGPDTAPGSTARQLSEALVRMSLARWRGDAATGLAQARLARTLVATLTVSQRTSRPELSPLLQAHLAAFELGNEALGPARAALERGARAFRPKPAPEIDMAAQVVAADCLGRLAWLEATNGELTAALHHASDVLTARPADSNEIGVIHAQLATVWCHISRTELDQASQRLANVTVRQSTPADGDLHPEIACATALTTARLAAVLGRERIACETPQPYAAPGANRRLEDQLRLIRAEADLDAGHAASALQVLGEVHRPSSDAHALRARAWIQLGDLASVGALLRVRPTGPLTLITQVGLDLVQGWVAQARGDRQHQRTLVDRALRVAEREQLRAPIAWAASWLREVISSDPALLRRHSSFLASVRANLLDDTAPEKATRLSVLTAPVSPLTERELEVLQRLGTLSTNIEIAADLYLSPNTIKTHLKSLYRKLDVTRRSDAFRRGRSLGLC
jgi:LuxR family maltose regulon positive regulatory protein